MAAALALDTESATLAGAFLLGVVFATVATLRVVKAVTDFFAGYLAAVPPKDRAEEHEQQERHPDHDGDPLD